MRNFIFNFVLLVVLDLVRCAEERRPLMLVSFDGLRADKFDQFLRENPFSNFNRFIQQGVKADFMRPIFPTLTFPNHWTIVTGIVSNSFYFPEYEQKAKLGSNFETKFWNYSEPIWITAKNQGLKTAASFWVGSEAVRRRPDIFLTFSKIEDTYERMEMLVNWFAKFKLDLALVYFDEPDSTGHNLGPSSQEYLNKIKEMDLVIGYLFSLLEREKLSDEMNVLIVSDHGMADLKLDYKIYLDDLIDINLIDMNKSALGTVSLIYPKSDQLLEKVYESLINVKHLSVYKKENIPEDFHFKENLRIAGIIAVAYEGYLLTTKEDKKLARGAHGYENSLESMRSIFLAKGPDFVPGKKFGWFENVNVYPLMCKLMRIKCNPNNGTISVFDTVLKS